MGRRWRSDCAYGWQGPDRYNSEQPNPRLLPSRPETLGRRV